MDRDRPLRRDDESADRGSEACSSSTGLLVAKRIGHMSGLGSVATEMVYATGEPCPEDPESRHGLRRLRAYAGAAACPQSDRRRQWPMSPVLPTGRIAHLGRAGDLLYRGIPSLPMSASGQSRRSNTSDESAGCPLHLQSRPNFSAAANRRGVPIAS